MGITIRSKNVLQYIEKGRMVMTREEWMKWGSSLPLVQMDYPFDDPDLVVLRHQDTKKWFALFLYVKGRVCVNVKCDPFENPSLCELYEGITPGYHMNKRHWITIDLESDVPDNEIKVLFQDSYERTRKGYKKKNNKI